LKRALIQSIILAVTILSVPPLALAQQGSGFLIERIEIRGNDKTHSDVIIRSLELREGERLTPDGISRSRAALQRTRLFRTVHVASKPGSEQGTAIIMVYVQEKRFGDVGVSVEYTELDGFGLSADAYHVNLGGQGRVLGAEYGLGERFRYWGLSYSHPWLSGSDVSLHARVRGSVADRDLYREKIPSARGSYDLERVGAAFGLGRQLGMDHQVIFSYSFEEVDVGGVRPPGIPAGGTPYSDEVVATQGTSPTALFTIDVRNRADTEPWGSRPGYELDARADFSTDFIGSTGDYVRLQASLYGHFQTIPHQLVTLGFRSGIIAGDPPFYERFYLDDQHQLRGIERRSIAPEGGERLLSAEALYSVSLSELGRGYLFAETAGIWRTTGGQTIRRRGGTVGIGILLLNRVDISFGFGTGVLIIKSHRFGGINVGL